MTPKERLQEIQKIMMLSDNAVAMAIGVTQAAYSRYVREGETIGKVVQKFLEHFDDVNANWLITGQGQMFISNERKEIETNAIAQYEMNYGHPDDAVTLREDVHKLTKDIESLRARNIELERQNAVLEYRLNKI